jgi:hypothetical protein
MFTSDDFIHGSMAVISIRNTKLLGSFFYGTYRRKNVTLDFKSKILMNMRVQDMLKVKRRIEKVQCIK